MKRVLTIGSALIDVFITSDSFMLDRESGQMCFTNKSGKMEVEHFDVRTGGGAGNTAVGFARIGFQTSCIAEMGRDELSHLVVDTLQEEGVNQKYLINEKKEQTGGSVILVSNNGERMVLVHRGAASMLDPQDISAQAIEEVDWLHLSSIAGKFATLEHIFTLVRQHQKKMSWNPGSGFLKSLHEREWDIASFPVEVLLLNKQEWEMVGDKQQAFLDSVPKIVITDGSKGGQVFVRGEEAQNFQAEPVTAIDNTGAGDAFAVGFVAGLLHEKPVEQAIEWGKKNAASVVQEIGAKPGLLYLSDVQ
jgi:sugar/nucleoside kinase (ribokinase family)